jgi:intraflagellar transport protein 81
MREELASARAELVILQRTEQILKSRHKNIDDFNAELEASKGVEGYRGTQRALEEMAEKTYAEPHEACLVLLRGRPMHTR